MSVTEVFKGKAEFRTPEHCHIVEMWNRGDDPVCSIARSRVEPGVTTQLHSLSRIAERYVILEGEGKVEVDNAPAVTVAPLDVILIAPGVSQRISNTGKSDLIFLCICTPRFTPEAYVNLEG